MTIDELKAKYDRIFGFQCGGIGYENDEQFQAEIKFYRDVLNEIYYGNQDAKSLASVALGRML